MGKLSLEKVLSISAIEYCTMMGRSLDEYIPKGIFMYDALNLKKNIMEHKNIPEGVEVIVGFKMSGENDYNTYGTALVPKESGKDYGSSKKESTKSETVLNMDVFDTEELPTLDDRGGE